MGARTRLVWLALWPISAAVVVLGELGYWLNGFAPRETFPLDLSVSSVSIVAGLVLWRLRPGNPIGALLVMAGMLWAIAGIGAYGNPWTIGVGQWLQGAQNLVFAHILIAYPTGRLRSRWSRMLVGAGYSLVVVNLFATMTWTLPGGRNALAVWDAPGLHDVLDSVASVGGSVYATIGILIVARRWWVASPAARRVYGPVLATALLFAVATAADGIVQGITGTEPDWVFFPPDIVLLLIPLAFLFGLLRARLGQVAVGELVVELGASGTETLEQALARTLRDTTLRVGYRVNGAEAYVDAAGTPVEVPAAGDARVATAIERDGQPLALIVHDRALLEQPELIDSVTAAARLALDNERLQAQLRAQLEALRASRARLIRTGDAERRRLERDLHDGAQQRLLGLGLALQLLRSRLDDNDAASGLLGEAEGELQLALHELRELARGIHPAILTDHGLASAARTLAGRAPIPVAVNATDERFPAAAETVGYFVIAEALANVAKYATAEQAWVSIERRNGFVIVEIRDDGVGGADPAAGSGLSGLADRVGAIGGHLTLDSPAGVGTRIRAEIPCA